MKKLEKGMRIRGWAPEVDTSESAVVQREVARKFAKMVVYEPRLAELLLDVMRVQPTVEEWKDYWYCERVLPLVGDDREEGPELLQTDEAYDCVLLMCLRYLDDGRSYGETMYKRFRAMGVQ